MEGRRIVKGENFELPADVRRLHVVLGWNDTTGERTLDASALLLSPERKVASDADFVFYNQPASVDGSVSLLGQTVTDTGVEERLAIDLEAVSGEVATIALAASVDRGRFGDLQDLRLVVLDGAGGHVARYDITDATEESAFVFGEVYRRNDVWKVRAVGQGWANGLAGLATDFGVCVDEEPDDVVPEPSGETDYVVTVEADDPADAVAVVVDGPAAAEDLVPAEETVAVEELVPAEETVAVEELVPAEEVALVEEPVAVEEAEPTLATVIALPVAAPAPAPRTARSRSTGVRTRRPRKATTAVGTHSLADADGWQPARLFSVAGIGAADEQEKRATSALLSTMFAVKQFGRCIATRLGGPGGNVETFTEVQFRLGERTVIPDGVLKVARAGRVWTALLEVKTGSGQLRREQVESYLDVAREQGYDAVVTLSNEISPGAGEHPIAVDKRKTRKVALIHVSWAEIIHEAKMALTHRGISDPNQAWMLGELIRYLDHPRSGAATFDDMGPAWVPVREAVVAGTLRAGDRKAPTVADAWLRLVRWLSLKLTADLGVSVASVMPRKLAGDPVARRQAVVAKLAADGVLDATLRVPGAVGPVSVSADVRVSQVRTSVEVPAPQEWNSTRRVAWLLRQLGDEAPGDLLVEVIFVGRSETACERLADVRVKPTVLVGDRSLDIKAFRLTACSPLGQRRSGVRGAFVPTVVGSVETFYRTVVQGLRPWPSPAPKLPADTTDENAGESAEILPTAVSN
jgi:stress response protein SCP2